jgi:translation initiation factor IF-3
LGIFNIENALLSFDRKKFNLTQVTRNPPTCKLIPILHQKEIIFNKEKEKKQKANVLVTKEVIYAKFKIELNNSIGPHDLEVKVNRARSFFAKGYRVQFTVIYTKRSTKQNIELYHDIIKLLNGEAIQIDSKNIGKKLVFSMDRVKANIPKLIKDDIKDTVKANIPKLIKDDIKDTVKPPTTLDQIDIQNQVKIQGDIVRKLKFENAPTVHVQLEIQKLLELKKHL